MLQVVRNLEFLSVDRVTFREDSEVAVTLEEHSSTHLHVSVVDNSFVAGSVSTAAFVSCARSKITILNGKVVIEGRGFLLKGNQQGAYVTGATGHVSVRTTQNNAPSILSLPSRLIRALASPFLPMVLDARTSIGKSSVPRYQVLIRYPVGLDSFKNARL